MISSQVRRGRFDLWFCCVALFLSFGATLAFGQATLPGTFHEDLNSLKLDTSGLKAEIPVPGAIDDDPSKPFIRQRFQLQWRPDDRLDLYIVRPRGVAKPPVILYLYSFPQDK